MAKIKNGSFNWELILSASREGKISEMVGTHKRRAQEFPVSLV